MIRYTLSCDAGHRCDSWFQSAAAFDRLAAAGLVSCAVCGSVRVDKALMAPAVALKEPAVAGPQVAAPRAPDGAPGQGTLSTPANPAEQALAELRRRIEAESEYVGLSFATEARAMHDGRAPGRAIWGEARPDEARALIEDGVPVAPLPFLPRGRSN